MLPAELVDMLRGFPKSAHPMQALQASLAGLGMVFPKVDLKDAASKDAAARSGDRLHPGPGRCL